MNLEIFTLCDAATDSQGKLNILGTFDTVFTEGLPSMHAQCMVVVKIRLKNTEKKKHKVALDFLDESGNSIFPSLQGDITGKAGNIGKTHSLNIIYGVQNLIFREYGEHKIVLTFDGKKIASLPLLVAPSSKKSHA